MGIYSDGNVYGVCFSLNEDIILEKKYEEIITPIQIQEIKEFYNKLTIEEKNIVIIRFYTACSSTYELESSKFMTWFPSDKNLLEKLFNTVLVPSSV